jgi:hypothetical protein
LEQNGQMRRWQSKPLLVCAGILAALLLVLFLRGIAPNHVVFSNDGPLGLQNAICNEPGAGYSGVWADLNWLGMSSGNRTLSISETLRTLCGPLFTAKLYAPISLFLVGLCACFCFREFGFNKLVCVLGGLAAALNSDFVATACWGVASQPIGFALGYAAMGLVANLNDRPWLRIILAGLCVGLNVIEAADIGAIFSVFVGAWVVAHAFSQEGTVVQRVGRGVIRLGLVAGFAGLIASSAIIGLIGVTVKGVVGTAQDEQTKAARWAEATQWSLPKREIVSLFVPGFYGFRMDTPSQLPEWQQKAFADGSYWGFIGRGSDWDQYLASDRKGGLPGNFLRYGMGSGYMGMLIWLAAAWAAVQSFRKNSFFSRGQRLLLWFWLGVLVVSTGLMFGRHAPFYEWFYKLPYVSTIRNPAKFMHVFSWALIIVAGYGLHGLTTLYLERAVASGKGILENFSLWWRKSSGFDKKWVGGMFAVVGLAFVAWIAYGASRPKVEAYIAELNQYANLQQTGKPELAAAAEAATATFNFTLRQVRWAFISLTVTVGLLALLVSGSFAGARARTAGFLLGALLLIDLGWQAQPWVVAQNWQARYVEAADNPVIGLLKAKPYEHRVSRIPERTLGSFRVDPRIEQMEGMFQSVYGSEWTQHIFPYYNIQTLNIVQLPRRPVEYDAFELASQFLSQETLYRVTRRLELSATDYLVGAAPLVSLLNQAYDPEQQRFKPVLFFEFYQERQGGPILTRTNQTGPFAVMKFTGALPRAKLYTDWQVANYDTNTAAWMDSYRKIFPPGSQLIFDSLTTNDQATVELMMRKSFEPAKTVLLAEPLATAPPTNAPPGTVEYVSYEPKRIVLKANATAPSVLLLNDKYDPSWKVTVNGQPAPLLRCNYLVRGVAIPAAGEHTIEFTFSLPMGPTYVTLAALVLGIGLTAYLIFVPRRSK